MNRYQITFTPAGSSTVMKTIVEAVSTDQARKLFLMQHSGARISSVWAA
jgi:hypothetical protein